MLLFSFGCSKVKKPSGFPKLVKDAHFTLTQDGTPLAGAKVKFFKGGDKVDDSRWGIFGESDENGVVHLATYNAAFAGAPLGTFKVTVFKDEVTPSQYGEEPPKTGAEIAEWQKKRMSEYRPGYHLVDPVYMNEETTTLTVTISESGASPDTFELGPAVREEFIPLGTSPTPQ